MPIMEGYGRATGRWERRTLLALAAVLLATVTAAPAASEDLELGSWVVDAELSAARGGFTTKSGLEVTFGIERALFLNETLQSLQHVQGGERPKAPLGVLVQSGPGNLAPGGPSASSVIQNTLDQQTIGVRTILDVSVSNLRVLRESARSELVRLQLIDALR